MEFEKSYASASATASTSVVDAADADVESLKRRLDRAAVALAEQKRLMTKAADEYGISKDLDVKRLRSSRDRARAWLKASLALSFALAALARKRGTRAAALERALTSCESDGRALERVNARLKLTQGMKSTSNDFASTSEIARETPTTLASCVSRLADVNAALSTSTSATSACERAVKAAKINDVGYFDDAARLRALLDDVNKTLDFKERAAESRERALRAVIAFLVIAVIALGSRSTAREMFRTSSARASAGRCATEDVVNETSAPAAAADVAPRADSPVASVLASPSKLARTTSKTTF